MKSNIGSIDRNIRLMAGMVMLVTGIMLNSLWGVVGVMLLATAVMDWCPLYTILRLNSCRFENRSTGAGRAAGI